MLRKGLLALVLMIFVCVPAYAAVEIKGGYSGLGANGVNQDAYMGGIEYLFNQNVGLTATIDAYNLSGTVGGFSYTSNTSIYSLFVTFHSPSQTETSNLAYLNDYLNMYYELGYGSMNSTVTVAGTTTTSTVGGFSYGLGLDIMPKSMVGAFIGYHGISLSGGSLGGLQAGIEVRF